MSRMEYSTMRVRDVMTRRLVVAKKSDSLQSILMLLANNNITGCPVVDAEKRVIGMVTQKDILSLLDVRTGINKAEALPLIMAALEGSGFSSLRRRMAPLYKKRAEEFMTRRIVAVDENHPLYDAVSLLNKHNISRLPVLRDGRLVGILSRSDIIKALK